MGHDLRRTAASCVKPQATATLIVADDWEYSAPIYNNKLATTHYKLKLAVLAKLWL